MAPVGKKKETPTTKLIVDSYSTKKTQQQILSEIKKKRVRATKNFSCKIKIFRAK